MKTSHCKKKLYVHDSLKGNLPKALNIYNKFIYINNQHNYNTRISHRHHVKIPKVNTQAYGINSISFQSSHAWNFFQTKSSDIKLRTRSRYFCKKIITNYFLNTYELKTDSSQLSIKKPVAAAANTVSKIAKIVNIETKINTHMAYIRT